MGTTPRNICGRQARMMLSRAMKTRPALPLRRGISTNRFSRSVGTSTTAKRTSHRCVISTARYRDSSLSTGIGEPGTNRIGSSSGSSVSVKNFCTNSPGSAPAALVDHVDAPRLQRLHDRLDDPVEVVLQGHDLAWIAASSSLACCRRATGHGNQTTYLGDAHTEELIEIVGENTEIAQALDFRNGFVRRLLQYSRVKGQPAQLPGDKQRSRRDRRGEF
jgi:hypothetical protein